MILAGHQPEYLSYIGFFSKVCKADMFALVDHVQFEKKDWQNRNRIRVITGELMMTVPVKTKGKFTQAIKDVEINNDVPWARKHWRSISLAYKDAPYFKEYKGFFEDTYHKKWNMLTDLDEHITLYMLDVFDINIPTKRTSEYGDIPGKKTDMIINMCKEFNADAYLSGAGGRDYVEVERFTANNMKHYFIDFKHPQYPQQFKPFIPCMSAIDMLFNCGPEESIRMIRESGGLVDE